MEAELKKYQTRGWQAFPILANTKDNPRVAWSKPFKGEWRENDNIGIVLGTKSAGLVDVDLDWPEAATTGRWLFGINRTLAFGRESKKYSHFLFQCDDAKKRVTFTLPKSFLEKGVPEEHALMVAEIRTNGCYTMFPPSKHPSGEVVAWENECAVRPIDFATLKSHVGIVAFFAVCERFWPGEGLRHDAALAFAGVCKWAGIH